MKTYFSIIQITQQILLFVSIGILVLVPTLLALYPESVPVSLLFTVSHISLFFVMTIRPLSDLLPKLTFIRPLVILRKGTGVLSAAIIVSFLISKLVSGNLVYFTGFFTELFSLATLAKCADITAVILLITSNNLSKKLLGSVWKKIQRLSYVYFYASSIYVFILFNDYVVLGYMIIVTILTSLAFLANKQRKLNKQI